MKENKLLEILGLTVKQQEEALKNKELIEAVNNVVDPVNPTEEETDNIYSILAKYSIKTDAELLDIEEEINDAILDYEY